MIKLHTLFDLEEDRVRNEIIKRGASRVLVQLPEGLKLAASEIASIIEATGALPIISADPCYGACDLAIDEATAISADLIIHYGHSEVEHFSQRTNTPIIYIEAKAKTCIDFKKIVEDSLRYLEPWESIGLTTTVQHAHLINEAKDILKNAGKKVYIGHEPGLKYPGQVLGCDYRNAKVISNMVEAFLFIGGGLFHAIGLFLSTMKTTIAIDPFEGKIQRVDDYAKRVIKRRWADISEAMRVKKWGIIIGLKTGQFNFETSLKIMKDLKNSGREVILLAMKEITPEALLEFPTIESYVNTACPRVSLYETQKFPKPVLTPKETYVALGKISWEDYLKSGLL
ncbi:MAG: diphthamide biosynthesis enzyme Dph2 [Candidatus Bathyarchaeia archaeon]